MKKIWLVRHAESMSQIDESVCPVNPVLSPRGEKQAKQLKARIGSIKSEFLFCLILSATPAIPLLSCSGIGVYSCIFLMNSLEPKFF